MSKKILIIVHIFAATLFITVIFFLASIIQNYRVSYALEVSSSAMEKNSLSSQILNLKTENEKLKLSFKEYLPSDYTGWKLYENKKLGYFFMYPADASVNSTDLVNAIYIKSSDLDLDASVIHFDSPFYHPPVGTDVAAWLKDKVSYDEVGDRLLNIAGFNTLHLVTLKSTQVYASDDFYFIKGNQLFDIKIVHSGNREDWDLYYKFLKSFKFAN